MVQMWCSRIVSRVFIMLNSYSRHTLTSFSAQEELVSLFSFLLDSSRLKQAGGARELCQPWWLLFYWQIHWNKMLYFYCSPELWVPAETAWEIFITWSPLQRMSLKSLLLSFFFLFFFLSEAPCHILGPSPQLETSAQKLFTETKLIHLLCAVVR